jgi:AcrR family transcriptional regulator
MEPYPNKYEIRTNKKKTAIISAAKELFQEKGFVNTSVKEIAAIAHVSQVSLYNYFGSKDALVIECAKSIIQDSIDKAHALLAADMPYLDKLNTALSLCASDINASLTTYLTTSALADKNFMKLLSDGVSELLNDLYLHFIEAGKREGYIDHTLPSPLILKYISAVNTIDISPENYHEEINAIHQIFLHGLLK